MPTKRMWLGHAPDVPQIDQVEFDETAASVIAEGTDLIFEINGKELLVENPHPLDDDDAAQAGDTTGILTLLQKAEAAINSSAIPEFAELEASVESPDADPDSPYHRLRVTTREQFHGWPFGLTVKAPNPTIDIDYVQKGAPGQNEKQSYYITPTPSGGDHRIKWNLGSGIETSGTIPVGADADDVKGAMIAGMPTITEDNVIVTGSNTQADPFVIELTDDLAETSFGLLSVDVSELTGNGDVQISTLQHGGTAGGGSNIFTDTFTDSGSTNLSAHTADTAQTWTQVTSETELLVDNDGNDRLRLYGGDPDQTIYTIDSAIAADFVGEFTVPFGGQNLDEGFGWSIGVVYRYSDADNFMLAYINFSQPVEGEAVRSIYVYKEEGGFYSLVAANSLTDDTGFGSSHTITLTVSGASHVLEFTDGFNTLAASGTSSFNSSATTCGLLSEFNAMTTEAQMWIDNLTFDAVTTQHEKWAIYTNGQGGTFDIDNPASSNPQTLSAGATTAQVKSALETLYSGSTFTVTGGGSPADPWIAEDDTATDLTEPTGDGANLTGGFDGIVAELQDGSPPLDTIWDVFIHNTTSGNLTFEFLGRPTASIAYGATGATVLTALQNLSPGDFSTGIWTVVDTGIGSADYRITAGGRYSGALQTLKAHNESLVGTALGITHTTIQQPTGRNWIDNPVNYRDVATGLAGLPEDGDELFVQIGGESHSMRFGSLAGVELKRFILGSLFSGHIGLPEINPGGYAEYRPTHITLEFEAGTQSFENPNVLIGVEQGQGSGLVRLKTLASDEVHIRVERTGGPAEDSRPSFCWDGQNVANTLNLIEGFVGIAVFGFDEADLNHATQRGGLLRFGEGTDIGAGGFDRTAGETFGRASIGGAAVVFGG